ncbi:MAG: aminotransferase class I/II-fold pyridoxal phosphate-dependent enzyme [Phycisphaerales bacterium]|nr:aminotransferase class I/II-fold pyridoxal phosphate-dependent enzyme [Phycisphaerales bacterium]|tara:strand:- start:16383 stop:17528 length:1146 start_codon:yes stop_codon:yes gene_type:complete
MNIPLFQHDLPGRELQDLAQELCNGNMMHGSTTETLSHELAQQTKQSEGVVFATYADAASLLLMAMDIHEGHEIILPAFASTTMTTAVLSTGATPVYADCNPRTLNIDAEAIQKLVRPETRAIVATNVFGNPADLPQIASLCGQLEIPMIEDVSGGLGATVDGRHAGSFGWASIIDLGEGSVIGCGQGGGVTTSNLHLAQRCRSLQSGAALDCSRNQDDHPGPIGRQSRLTDIQAAVAMSQLRHIDEILSARASAASSYTQRLAGTSDLVIPTVDPGTSRGWPAFVVRLDDAYGCDERDEILGGMDRHDIAVAAPWTPPPLIPQVSDRTTVEDDRNGWPVAEFVSQRTIALPIFGGLTDRDVGLVTQTLELMMQRTTFRRS